MKEFKMPYEPVLNNIREVMTRKLLRAPSAKWLLLPTKLKTNKITHTFSHFE